MTATDHGDWPAAHCRGAFEEMHQRTVNEMERIAENAALKAIDRTFKLFGIDTTDPFKSQRHFMVMREITEKAMDPEYRKDLEHARKWRLEMEDDEGVSATLRHAERSRKFWGAALSRTGITVISGIMTGVVLVWWNDVMRVISKFPPPHP